MNSYRTSAFTYAAISLLAASLMLSLPLSAQVQTDSVAAQQRKAEQRGIVFSTDDIAPKHEARTLQGMAVGVNLVSALMYQMASYGELEVMGRINIKDKYFPTVELGLGHSDNTSSETSLHYKTSAPYIRLGLDYNFQKTLLTGNHLFGGLRYCFTTFDFDLDGPPLNDPVWHSSVPFAFTNQHSSVHWLEAVFGLETRLCRFLHAGWSLRYKRRLSQKAPAIGEPWYVPGFGANDSSCFGGAFNLIIDI